mmetsp:Transcript_12818/g.19224  ORF Transcript_12818/g.19224 Transcript_12818/m.19224 type:complete len:576 (-) Transcript_12818:191-1918(-)
MVENQGNSANAQHRRGTNTRRRPPHGGLQQKIQSNKEEAEFIVNDECMGNERKFSFILFFVFIFVLTGLCVSRRLIYKRRKLTRKGMSPAHLASRRDDWLSVLALARRGANLKQKTFNRGLTVAQVAAARGRIRVLRTLMEAGLLLPRRNIIKNKVDADYTEGAAVAAASRGRVEALRFLARSGTDLRFPVEWRHGISTPACAAARSGHFATVAPILFEYAGPSAFNVSGTQDYCAPAWILAKREKSLSEYKDFSDTWLKVRYPINGWNLAHFAVDADNADILLHVPTELLQATDNDGRTPADLAEYLGRRHCIAILRGEKQCPDSTTRPDSMQQLLNRRNLLWRVYLIVIFCTTLCVLSLKTYSAPKKHKAEIFNQVEMDVLAMAAMRGKEHDELVSSLHDLDARLAAVVALYASTQLRTQAENKHLSHQLREALRRVDSAEQEVERLQSQPFDIDALQNLDVSNLSRSRLSLLENTLPRLQLAVTREGVRREMIRSTNNSGSDMQPDGQVTSTFGQTNSAVDISTECIVCLNQYRSVAFGCGHLCVCYDCAYDLDECPICRVPIRERRRIFNS